MFEYNDRAKTDIEKRLASMRARIANQARIADALEARSRDPEALFFCGFEMAPDFLKVGDVVDSKYGHMDLRIVEIFRESGKVRLVGTDGDTENYVDLGVDRISSIQYGDVDLEEEPSLDPLDEYFGI